MGLVSRHGTVIWSRPTREAKAAENTVDYEVLRVSERRQPGEPGPVNFSDQTGPLTKLMPSMPGKWPLVPEGITSDDSARMVRGELNAEARGFVQYVREPGGGVEPGRTALHLASLGFG